MKDIVETLVQLTSLMERMNIKYALIGGLAVRAHSIPRATQDIDLVLSVSESQLDTLFEELAAAGFRIPEQYQSGWRDKVAEMPLVKVHRFMRDRVLDVDLFLVEFPFQQGIVNRAQLAEAEGIKVWIASPEDVILLKLVAARPRDLIDVADVLFMQGELDEAYMRRWARELGVDGMLDKALTGELFGPSDKGRESD